MLPWSDMATVSLEVESVLKLHGIVAEPHVVIHECDSAVEAAEALVGGEHVSTPTSIQDAVRMVRSHRIVAVVTSAEAAPAFIRALNAESVVVGTIAVDAEDAGSSAHLRAAGVMDVAQADPEVLRPMLRRAFDFAALYVLELAHRCESRRLLNRELALLGQPPESMSDDLSVFQPPPLPVGPLSVYNLEEASDAFETAYIDRVQQLCASAREAATHLGVSSATLSRRMRRESSSDGNPEDPPS